MLCKNIYVQFLLLLIFLRSRSWGYSAAKKKGTPISFKCKTSVRESWQTTVFSDEILGTIIKFISSGNSCRTEGDILDIYQNPICDVSHGEFLIDLKTTYEWHNGREIRCIAQYGSGNKVKDKYETSSTVIKITNRSLLSIHPSVVYFGSNTSVTLTCNINNDIHCVKWWRNEQLIATITGADKNGSCQHSETQQDDFSYFCDEYNRKYTLIIQPEFTTYGLSGVKWECSAGDQVRSNTVQFVITDLPSLSISDNVFCNTSNTVLVTCAILTKSTNPRATHAWYHTIDGKVLRTLHGDKRNDTLFQLQIPFCSIQEIGCYICHVTTGLVGLAELNASTEVLVLGPPVIVSKRTTSVGLLSSISVDFYSDPFPEDPVWNFGNKTIHNGSKYLKSTTVSKIKLTLHDTDVLVDGFTSTLKIRNFTATDRGLYKFTVRNSVLVTEEKIVLNKSDQAIQREYEEIKQCSSTLIGLLVSGTVVGTVLIMLIIQCFIRRFINKRKDTETLKQNNQVIPMTIWE